VTILGLFHLEVETRIQARRETIFAFFTDPVLYRRWMGDRAELDPRPGGVYRIHVPGGRVAEGQFVALEPPRRIVFTWGWVGSDEVPPGSTTVDIDLLQDGDVTVVRLGHSGLPSDASREQHVLGWRHYLGRLAVASAGDDPGPDPLGDSAIAPLEEPDADPEAIGG
jgi:uncharacterized protein YndB with AHSA1/START domain